jgi:predicted PurR-regulated permease PerM
MQSFKVYFFIFLSLLFFFVTLASNEFQIVVGQKVNIDNQIEDQKDIFQLNTINNLMDEARQALNSSELESLQQNLTLANKELSELSNSLTHIGSVMKKCIESDCGD